MKILVLNGSPKKKSDTFRMTDAFLKGLNKDGEHEINVIDVIDKDIAPCRGCFVCWQNMDGIRSGSAHDTKGNIHKDSKRKLTGDTA